MPQLQEEAVRTLMWTVAATLLAACGGSEPAPAPEPAPAKVEKKAKAEKKAEPKEEKVDLTTLSPEEQKAKLMEIGEKVYKTGGKKGLACNTCHQDNGKGVPGAFPPLAGQKDHMVQAGARPQVSRGRSGHQLTAAEPGRPQSAAWAWHARQHSAALDSRKLRPQTTAPSPA